jgi:hypothetical protein
LHVRQDKVDGGILFLRPLYDDNITTSDRRFQLTKGIDDEMIDIVEEELKRIQYLATLPLPHPELTNTTGKNDDSQGITASEDKVASFESIAARERQHRRNRRRFFGM